MAISASAAVLGAAGCRRPDELRLAAGRGVVTGRVVDADRFPVAGATVVVDPSYRATSDAQGAFSIALPAGRERVRFTAVGYRETTIDLEVRAGDVRFATRDGYVSLVPYRR